MKEGLEVDEAIDEYDYRPMLNRRIAKGIQADHRIQAPELKD